MTSSNECQTINFPPGITVIENIQYPNSSLPDGVRIVSMSEVTILRVEESVDRVDRVRITQLIGFVYPFKNQSAPWMSYELSLMLDNARFSEAKLWLSTDETEANHVSITYSSKLAITINYTNKLMTFSSVSGFSTSVQINKQTNIAAVL